MINITAGLFSSNAGNCRARTLAACALILIVLSGCAGGRELASSLAANAGFRPLKLDGGDFLLAAWFKPGRTKDLTVYIEGDGRAWLNRNRPSSDPTPVDPVGLKLALSDPGSNILYLARPCQYVQGPQARNCSPLYWTMARFSERIASSMNQALDRAKTLSGADRLHLVGYSGGGGLAVILAARRNDVASIMTLAGNLDHAAWTAHHRVTPLRPSLNPIDFAAQVRDIPQTHVVGQDDEIIPPFLVRSFTKLLNPSRSRLVILPNLDHFSDWTKPWPRLITNHRREWGKVKGASGGRGGTL